jgi:hypothetical protein
MRSVLFSYLPIVKKSNIIYNNSLKLRSKNMSVRATERLIGDAVVVTALAKSPQMIVKAINEETKIITTSWFSNDNAFQEGAFPASALDRVEAKKTKTSIKSKAKK